MSNTTFPALPAILMKLLEEEGGVEERSLLERAGSDAGRKALERLLDAGIVMRRGERIIISHGAESVTNAAGIVDFFRKLEELAAPDLLVRGMVNAVEGFRCLVHRKTLAAMIEGQGIEVHHIDEAIAAEERRGFVKRYPIAYGLFGGVEEKVFPFIPFHHYDDFLHRRLPKREDASASAGQGEVVTVEEEYLLGEYPAGKAAEARQYLRDRAPDLLLRVQREAFDIIWAYDRY